MSIHASNVNLKSGTLHAHLYDSVIPDYYNGSYARNYPEFVAPHKPGDIDGSWGFDAQSVDWVMAVGLGNTLLPASGNWWQLTPDMMQNERPCLVDDRFILRPDGSFSVSHGMETWLEPWMMEGAPEECGEPIAPFDNNSDGYKWYLENNDSTLVLEGMGAYIGLPKVSDGFELGSLTEVQPSISYEIIEQANDYNTMTLMADMGWGSWQFKLRKYEDL